MPFPDLRMPDPSRTGITVDTVVFEDLVDAFFGKEQERATLAHQRPLIEAGKDIDRFVLTMQSRMATMAIRDLDDLAGVLEHQLFLTRMLRKRLYRVRLELNKGIMEGEIPLGDDREYPIFLRSKNDALRG